MTEIIFTTVHGSHLYGMAGPFSDVDTYTVTTSEKRAVHRMTADADTVTIGWDTFLAYAFSGSHQAVEALFSQEKIWHSHQELEPMLRQMRVTGQDVLARYRRTITKFSYSDDFKRRRHAVRLWINLQSLRYDGWFNPRMTPEEILWATDLATSNTTGDELATLLHEGESAMGCFLHA